MSEDVVSIWRVQKTRYEPLALPPAFMQGPGKGRFDCPWSPVGYRVLYAAGTPNAAFIEALQRFRLDLAGIREVTESSPVGVPERDALRESLLAPSGYVEPGFEDSHKICSVQVRLQTSVANVTSSAVLERVRHELSEMLLESGLDDLDLSRVTSLRREVTQQVSFWAWQNGYAGISYVSRFGADLTCYALFEDRYELVGVPECIPVGKSDALLDAADTLRLHFMR